eukprot:Skav224624  [mRNA]  locus=scaffold2059:194556:201611:- [translate_table: standard]
MCPILSALVVVPLCSLEDLESFCIIYDGPLQQRAQRLQQAAQRVPNEAAEEAQIEPKLSWQISWIIHLTFWRSLRLGAVWHLAFISLYQLYIIIALINTLTLYLKREIHMDLELSALYTSIVFQVSIVGKLLMGAAMDSKFQAISVLPATAVAESEQLRG